MTNTATNLSQAGPESRTVLSRHRGAVALGIIVVVAAAVRFVGIGREAIWSDEAASLRAAQGTLYDVLIQYHHYENTPPLYYFLLNLVGKLLGTASDAVVRMPSAVFGVLAVVAVWFLARRATDDSAPPLHEPGDKLTPAFLAGMLAAISLQQVWFSQEARAYSLFAMAAIVSSIALLRALEKPTAHRYLLYVAASIMMCYSHFAAAGVLMAHFVCGVVAVWQRPGRDRAGFLGSQIAIGLACLPLLPVVLKTRGRMIGFNDRTITFAMEKFGSTYVWLFDNLWLLLPIVGLGLVGVCRGRANVATRVLIAGLVLLPPVPPLIGWYTGGAQYFTRHALPSGLAMAVAAAMGLSVLRRGWRVPVATALIVGTSISLWAGREQFRKPAMREAAAFVSANAKPGDTVIASYMLTGWSLDRYLHRTDVRRRDYDEFTIRQLAAGGEGINRIWIVFFQVPPTLTPYLKDSPMDLILEKSFHEVLVLLFERPTVQPVADEPTK